MSDSPAAPVPSVGAPASKLGLVLKVAAFVVVAVSFLYLERVPSGLLWPMRVLFALSVGYLLYRLACWIRRTTINGKTVVFSLILAAMMYGALHLICLVWVKLMSAKDDSLTTVQTTSLTDKSRRGVNAQLSGDSPVIFDAEVGWVHRAGYAWKGHSVSPQGLRGTKVYPETAPDPDRRFICVGDSFTFGYEETDDQTYPFHGEQLKPGTEWINLGVCGAGLTQALLQYRKNGRTWGGKYVVIGFMTNNNKRTVNCFRPFVSPDDPMTPLTKPYAKFADGKFSIEPNPYQSLDDYKRMLADEAGEIAKLYQLDYFTWSNQRGATNPVVRTVKYLWERREMDRNLDLLLNRPLPESHLKFRPGDDPYGVSLWHPKSPGFQANARVFDLFYEEVEKDGRVPLIVILPSALDVEERAKGKPAKHSALLAHFREKGYRHFDFLDSLAAKFPSEEMKKESFYVNTHFNGKTNRFLAEEIIKAFEMP